MIQDPIKRRMIWKRGRQDVVITDQARTDEMTPDKLKAWTVAHEGRWPLGPYVRVMVLEALADKDLGFRPGRYQMVPLKELSEPIARVLEPTTEEQDQ